MVFILRICEWVRDFRSGSYHSYIDTPTPFSYRDTTFIYIDSDQMDEEYQGNDGSKEKYFSSNDAIVQFHNDEISQSVFYNRKIVR